MRALVRMDHGYLHSVRSAEPDGLGGAGVAAPADLAVAHPLRHIPARRPQLVSIVSV
jgi:hypothetical protein